MTKQFKRQSQSLAYAAVLTGLFLLSGLSWAVDGSESAGQRVYIAMEHTLVTPGEGGAQRRATQTSTVAIDRENGGVLHFDLAYGYALRYEFEAMQDGQVDVDFELLLNERPAQGSDSLVIEVPPDGSPHIVDISLGVEHEGGPGEARFEAELIASYTPPAASATGHETEGTKTAHSP